MPEETTNVMTLTVTPENRVKRDPLQLRVLASRKEIVLKGDPANPSAILVSFVQKRRSGKSVNLDPKTVFDPKAALTFPLIIETGKTVRLPIRQDLKLKKRGTFELDHAPEFSRVFDLQFEGLEKDGFDDHSDFHIEC